MTKAPVFQDVQLVDAWGLHGVTKDDFIVYDSAGKLLTFLPISGSIDTVLTTPAGFANVVDALKAAN